MCTQAHQQKLDAGTESISRRHRANLARKKRQITCGWYPKSMPNFLRSCSPLPSCMTYFFGKKMENSRETFLEKEIAMSAYVRCVDPLRCLLALCLKPAFKQHF
jgi:hypothetical protein